MTAQLLTIFSGVVLLLVFGLVGWYRKRRLDREQGRREEHE